MRRTHNTDSRSFIHTKISSERADDSMPFVTADQFRDAIRHKQESLGRLSHKQGFRATSGGVNSSSESNALRNGSRTVAQSAVGTSSERIAGRAYVYELITCPLRGGCASYFYTLTVSCDHILLMHNAGEESVEIMRAMASLCLPMCSK